MRRPSFRVVLGPLAMALLCLLAGSAQALQPATGKVVLTIAGKIAERNSPRGAEFDMAMLEALPQKTFTTSTPWDRLPVKFSGPLLRDVLAAAKAQGTALQAIAVNDYKTTIPVSDTAQFDMVLAHRMNGQPIPPRTKGPLFIVYPYDSLPELQDVVYRNRSAWQLKEIVVE
ncbi:MAG: molybdopterin-dependent oxidoreductase [Burkholderiaceae bacterium]|nr:molybdopterin-dependent oxidoreductase [Burkholderiaceae bacterium]